MKIQEDKNRLAAAMLKLIELGGQKEGNYGNFSITLLYDNYHDGVNIFLNKEDSNIGDCYDVPDVEDPEEFVIEQYIRAIENAFEQFSTKTGSQG